MPENITPATERTIVVDRSHLGILTGVSLCFNALILLLLLIGVVCHHGRPKPPGPGQEFGRDGGRDDDDGGRPGFMRFHHHGFGDRHRGWGRGGDEDRGYGRGADEGRGGIRENFVAIAMTAAWAGPAA